MVSGEALKKLQEQIAAWPMTQRFVVQQLIEDYRRNREDCAHYRNHPNGLCYLHTEPKENERGYSGEPVCVEPDDFCSYGEPIC